MHCIIPFDSGFWVAVHMAYDKI